MGRPSDTREVLIAEALGDFVKVLDRIDAVQPTLEKSCSDLSFTADRLLGNIEPFQKRIAGMALETQDRTLGHIAKQANLVARNTAVEQIAAMQESARWIFKGEVGPSLERVARQLREANLRQQPSWKDWLTHGAAAVSAASCTFMLMTYLASTGAAQTRPVANVPSQGRAEPAPLLVRPRDRR
jgi:hypothetical protein